MSGKRSVVVPGFKAGAAAAGVRYPDRLDLGLILADRPCSAAGLFTRNRVKAPSVVLAERRLESGQVQAVLANSGNANACVGRRGMSDTLRLTNALARRAGINPGLVLMSSTGVIGEPLPADKMAAALPALIKALRPGGLRDFARAIMTTDTTVKLVSRKLRLGRGRVTLAAAAKGAGMIMPDVATMLAYLLTDARLEPPTLRELLAPAVEDSFNALTIDGDTSTNDSVIMMASGASGVRCADSADRRALAAAVNEICLELAQAMAADGEGATRWFRVQVEGAKSIEEADRVARRVANSPLVKTALHAADPNWGRIMAAVGSAGVRLNPSRVTVSFVGAKNSVQVVARGSLSPAYSEPRARKILSGQGFAVVIDLGRGQASRVILSCDLSADYVKINASYRS